jgi:hypothetical protein
LYFLFSNCGLLNCLREWVKDWGFGLWFLIFITTKKKKKKNPPYIMSHNPQPDATINLLSISTDLPDGGISNKSEPYRFLSLIMELE